MWWCKIVEKLIIIYDVDDVLNNLNEYCLTKLGLPWGTRFNTYENTSYTKEQADSLMGMYGNPETFRHLSYMPGARDIFDIEKTGKVKVRIVSRNFNQGVADVKMGWILGGIPGATSDNIEMQIGLGADKRIDKTADIIVEDCITNCIKYNKDTIKILIDKPNNKAEEYSINEGEHNIIRVDTLIDANNLIRKIVNNY